jgi:pyruvate kinase
VQTTSHKDLKIAACVGERLVLVIKLLSNFQRDCLVEISGTRHNRAVTGMATSVQVHAALIVVLTRGGSTARLVAKYRPSIPVLTVAVPVLTTDSLTWTCSGEGPARQCLVTRGLLPLLAEGSARATDTDTTDDILAVSKPDSAHTTALVTPCCALIPHVVRILWCEW